MSEMITLSGYLCASLHVGHARRSRPVLNYRITVSGSQYLILILFTYALLQGTAITLLNVIKNRICYRVIAGVYMFMSRWLLLFLPLYCFQAGVCCNLGLREEKRFCAKNHNKQISMVGDCCKMFQSGWLLYFHF